MPAVDVPAPRVSPVINMPAIDVPAPRVTHYTMPPVDVPAPRVTHYTMPAINVPAPRARHDGHQSGGTARPGRDSSGVPLRPRPQPAPAPPGQTPVSAPPPAAAADGAQGFLLRIVTDNRAWNTVNNNALGGLTTLLETARNQTSFRMHAVDPRVIAGLPAIPNPGRATAFMARLGASRLVTTFNRVAAPLGVVDNANTWLREGRVAASHMQSGRPGGLEPLANATVAGGAAVSSLIGTAELAGAGLSAVGSAAGTTALGGALSSAGGGLAAAAAAAGPTTALLSAAAGGYAAGTLLNETLQNHGVLDRQEGRSSAAEARGLNARSTQGLNTNPDALAGRTGQAWWNRVGNAMANHLPSWMQ